MICPATKKSGEPCKSQQVKGGRYCAFHRHLEAQAEVVPIDFSDLPDETMLAEETAPTPRVLDNLSELEAAAAQFADQYATGMVTPEVDEDAIHGLAAGTARMEALKKAEIKDIQAQERRQLEEAARARKEGRPLPPPLRAHALNTLEDRTLGMMTGPDGKLRFDPTKKIPRVVRLRDGENRINYGRASAVAGRGYQPEIAKETGKPVVSELGILMTCDIEAEAQNRALAEKNHTRAAEETETQFLSEQNDGVYGRIVPSKEAERDLAHYGI